jgi:hypothetical protein
MLRSASPQPVHRHFRKRRSLALARHFLDSYTIALGVVRSSEQLPLIGLHRPKARFQPGTFLQCRAYAEESYQEAMVGAKCLLRRRASSKKCESLQRG